MSDALPQRHLSRLWPPLAYLALALAMTWPLAARLGDALQGGTDPQQQAWILAWDVHALLTDPLGVWQAPIFYPYPDTLAYHDHLLLLAVAAAPLIWATGSPVPALNVLLLLSFALSGWAVYSLALDMLEGAPSQTSGVARQASRIWPAFIAGAAFAFCSYRMSHLPHLNLLQTMWLPWALLFLRRLLRPEGRWRDALLFGLFAALQCANVLYYSFFAAAALGGFALLWALRSLYRRLCGAALPWRAAGRLLAGGALAALLTAPFMLPYLRIYETLGIVRSPRELDNWSAPLTAYLKPAPGSRIYGGLGGPFELQGAELALFPGFLVSALAGAALLGAGRELGWRRAADHGGQNLDTLYLALLAAGAFVLSLGTGLRLERGGPLLPVPLPYALLYERLPGFGSMRVPARWGMLVALALALLAAKGLALLIGAARARPRRWPGVAALALVLAEALAAPVALSAAPDLATAPPVYAWLGAPEQRDIRVVLELPVGPTPRGAELDRIMRRHYYSMAHWKSLPVAYGALIPFGTTDLLAHAQHLPNAEALRFLQLVGVDTLVLHRAEYDPAALEQLLAGLDASPLARRRAEVGDALVYTLLPGNDTAALDLPPGASVALSADERVPGLAALGLARRWERAGHALYGPARVRYYGPLAALRPGQVPDYGLLAEGESPAAHGFAAEPLWGGAGMLLYRRPADLRASLDLGVVPRGAFHPAYPDALDIAVEPGGATIGDKRVVWEQALTAAVLELDIASLGEQQVQAGAAKHTIAPGVSTLAVAAPLGERVRVAGLPGQTAVLRVRVREASDAPQGGPSAELAVAAQSSFDGSRLRVDVEAGGQGELLVAVRGAAALDDRPLLLLEGIQPIPPAGSGAWSFEVDLLRPEAPWLTRAGEPQDGRYQVYLAQAGAPGMVGLPIATFSIRGGAVVDARPVPLPLTALR